MAISIDSIGPMLNDLEQKIAAQSTQIEDMTNNVAQLALDVDTMKRQLLAFQRNLLPAISKTQVQVLEDQGIAPAMRKMESDLQSLRNELHVKLNQNKQMLQQIRQKETTSNEYNIHKIVEDTFKTIKEVILWDAQQIATKVANSVWATTNTKIDAAGSDVTSQLLALRTEVYKIKKMLKARYVFVDDMDEQDIITDKSPITSLLYQGKPPAVSKKQQREQNSILKQCARKCQDFRQPCFVHSEFLREGLDLRLNRLEIASVKGCKFKESPSQKKTAGTLETLTTWSRRKV